MSKNVVAIVEYDVAKLVSQIKQKLTTRHQNTVELGELFSKLQKQVTIGTFKHEVQKLGPEYQNVLYWISVYKKSLESTTYNSKFELQPIDSKGLNTQVVENTTVTPTEYVESSIHFSSESEEWYTPPSVLDSVLTVLGEIDLDPCSNPKKTVPAKNYFTQEEDGLSKSWLGKIFMNPPYGNVIDGWVTKLVSEYNEGNVTEAIALLPGRIDTGWFQKFSGCTWSAMRGRIKFLREDGAESDPAPFPSIFVYLGKNNKKFSDVFSKTGNVFDWKASYKESQEG